MSILIRNATLAFEHKEKFEDSVPDLLLGFFTRGTFVISIYAPFNTATPPHTHTTSQQLHMLLKLELCLHPLDVAQRRFDFRNLILKLLNTIIHSCVIRNHILPIII